MGDPGTLKRAVLEYWLEYGIWTSRQISPTLGLTYILNELGDVLTPNLSHHYESNVFVVLCEPLNAPTFAVHRAQLEFWSPYLRKLIAASIPRKPFVADPQQITITLHNVESDVFRIFATFMETKSFYPPAHMLSPQPGDEVPMMIKVWVMANRFQGPSLVLRDQAMTVIYYTYVVNGEGAAYTRFGTLIKLVPFSPDVVRYVLQQTKSEGNSSQMSGRVCLTTPLMQLLLAILARPDLEISAGQIALWKALMEEIPEFGQELERRLACSDLERRLALQISGNYMGCLGEVDPGWRNGADGLSWPDGELD